MLILFEKRNRRNLWDLQGKIGNLLAFLEGEKWRKGSSICNFDSMLEFYDNNGWTTASITEIEAETILKEMVE